MITAWGYSLEVMLIRWDLIIIVVITLDRKKTSPRLLHCFHCFHGCLRTTSTQCLIILPSVVILLWIGRMLRAIMFLILRFDIRSIVLLTIALLRLSFGSLSSSQLSW